MGKTRDLFKKIRDTKGTFHAKKGSIKDRNGMDLTEPEYIKRWQEYTEELYTEELGCIAEIKYNCSNLKIKLNQLYFNLKILKRN